MARPEDARRHPRHNLPVYVEAPAWEHAPIEAKDVSAGGLYITVRGLPAAPQSGARVGLSFQVAGEAFHNCSARIAWAQPTRGGTWGIGLEIDIPDEDRRRLARKLDEFQPDPRPLWHA
ncbi:MAG: hypothetical protein A3J27_01135 [Candidatus Tectomicrobia bacterium RIFCSPLOWO2_12_FULL_69_37]|nr:MAG: hypothetical protein A3I72_06205 [Candidatus Tectomicrobia bacterium RIFCSPLOWO2_02_FULL_70_19]OGL66058.1 MAG: hypothetical protein A3J27_01135 [Candidatus Tectomicrobia bacterium RIFCSPLOWO2_12_FULL_69_37]